MPTRNTALAIERIDVSAYTIPTDLPEADGTIAWSSTTLIVAEARAGGVNGLGYTYADTATATVIHDLLSGVVTGRNAFDVPGSWAAMVHSIRNLGRPGITSMAISAIDVALWDLKAKLLDLPLCKLLGQVRDAVPVYGSGGFTSYSIEQLQKQLGDWVHQGIPRVKMKIGTHPEDDLNRVRAAREAIGPGTQLYVDANGAYTRKQALEQAEAFVPLGVVWFEEPVSSDDLEGLHLIRNRAPAGMNIAAGEYGYDLWYFRRMLEAEAVDVQQADGSRCGGITGFLRVGSLVEARSMQLSAHCAPSLHLHACCAVPNLWPIEYFHDHVRIERMLFDGAVSPVDGALHPDLSRPGIGLEFKRQDAERFAV
ncbi:MAG TPA: enolase C-terminal domain-like protein [Ktedonobacterales bacterium]